MQLTLFVEHETDNVPPQEFIVQSEEILIGRSVTSDLVLPDETCVISRKHAKIRMENGGFFLIDLGSHNRSYVNNRAVEADVPFMLQLGDVIQIGRYRLEVKAPVLSQQKDVVAELNLTHLQGDSLPVSQKAFVQEQEEAAASALDLDEKSFSEYQDTKPQLAFKEREVMEHQGDGYSQNVKLNVESVVSDSEVDGDNLSSHDQTTPVPEREVKSEPVVWGADVADMQSVSHFSAKDEPHSEPEAFSEALDHLLVPNSHEPLLDESFISDELDVEEELDAIDELDVEEELDVIDELDVEEELDVIDELDVIEEFDADEDEPRSSEEYLVDSNPFMGYAGELRRVLMGMQVLYDKEKSLERHIDLVDALSEALRGQNETLVGLAVLAALKKK